MPSYLNLSKTEFQKRIEKAKSLLEKCRVCPRECGVNRLKGERGFCKLGRQPMVSAFHPHFGEESCLVGRHGSGTIFFTYCNLACVYCQNYDISQLGAGREISIEELAQTMIELQNMACHNINFVTPTSQVPQILESLPIAIEKGLKIPIVYNTNAYDSVETLRILDSIIDIYMPDAKYSDNKIAKKYSNVPCENICLHKERGNREDIPGTVVPKTLSRGQVGYFETMKKAIKEMHRQVGDLILNTKIKNQNAKSQIKIQNFEKIQKEFPEGVALKGLLVRHLVLPNNLAGTEKIMEFISKEISLNTFINIMDQYRPCYKAHQYPELNRSITQEEYQKALALVQKSGLKRIYH